MKRHATSACAFASLTVHAMSACKVLFLLGLVLRLILWHPSWSAQGNVSPFYKVAPWPNKMQSLSRCSAWGGLTQYALHSKGRLLGARCMWCSCERSRLPFRTLCNGNRVGPQRAFSVPQCSRPEPLVVVYYTHSRYLKS